MSLLFFKSLLLLVDLIKLPGLLRVKPSVGEPAALFVVVVVRV